MYVLPACVPARLNVGSLLRLARIDKIFIITRAAEAALFFFSGINRVKSLNLRYNDDTKAGWFCSIVIVWQDHKFLDVRILSDVFACSTPASKLRSEHSAFLRKGGSTGGIK